MNRIKMVKDAKNKNRGEDAQRQIEPVVIWSVDDLEALSAKHCLDIYNEYSENAIKEMTTLMQKAFETGRKLNNDGTGNPCVEHG